MVVHDRVYAQPAVDIFKAKENPKFSKRPATDLCTNRSEIQCVQMLSFTWNNFGDNSGSRDVKTNQERRLKELQDNFPYTQTRSLHQRAS